MSAKTSTSAVLVTGVTGFIGREVTRRLVATGFDQPFSMALRNVTLRVTDGFPLLSTAQLTLGDFDPAAIQLDLARGGGSLPFAREVFGPGCRRPDNSRRFPAKVGRSSRSASTNSGRGLPSAS